ncbi:glutathione S-transferase family protein [Leucothrix pacifica]|uniref:Glutathione S-transferase n=1 Tax=Leucothrix pacifica TaxID=1247513 RepID=A0A317CAT0_9GAMM|nr:glutathione S-transferase family protein [Leucothrix pacifica]PWQ95479.1 glutathione S-transferase [Leucothrix pacifica]
MSALTLYTNPQSRGLIAHWMLEELGEPYDIVTLDYESSMQAPEYLAINPMGKVPALKHGDTVITETAAICTYLAARFPEKGLIPAVDDPALGTFYRWLFFAAGPVEQAITVKSQGWNVKPEQEMTVGFGNYTMTIDALETALQPGPFICGEQFTAADVYVGAQIRWGLMFGTIDKRPLFEAYAERMSARPALQRSEQMNQPDP